MSTMLPTPKLNDDVLDVLKRLHARVEARGHTLSWFVDRDNRVRLLVTVVTEWHETIYSDGEAMHGVRIPVAHSSADLDLASWEAGALGPDGLLRHIEDHIGLSLDPDAAFRLRDLDLDRRVA